MAQDISRERNCSDLSHEGQILDENCKVSPGVLFKPLLSPYSESPGKGSPALAANYNLRERLTQMIGSLARLEFNQHLVQERGTPLYC